MPKLVPKSRDEKAGAFRWHHLNPLKSVGMKLFLIVFCSILLCVLAGGLLSSHISKEVIEAKVSEAGLQTIGQTTEKLDLLMRNFTEVTDQFTTDQVLQQQMDTLLVPKQSSYTVMQVYAKLTERLRTYAMNNPMVSDSYLIPVNENARESITATSSSVIGTSSILLDEVTAEPWFQKVLDTGGEPVWIPTTPARPEAASNTSQEGPAIGIARMLRSSSADTDVFVLLLEIRLSDIAKTFRSIDLGSGSAVSLTDGNGRYVYAADTSLIGQPLTATTGAGDAGFRTVAAPGGDELVFHATSAVNGWQLVGTVPVRSLVKDADRITSVTWIIAAVAALMACGIGIFVVRIVAAPIGRLRKLMAEGAVGNLAVRSAIKSQDEIGQLSQSFNRMMTQITVLVEQMRISARETLGTAVELAETSRNTAGAAAEIAVATREIAGGAASLAMEAEKGNELAELIDMQRKLVGEASAHMGASAAEIGRASGDGTVYMTELIVKTGQAEELIRNMTIKIERLKNSAGAIRGIVDVLDNIAKQTNILSLNATIEASRAGAAGKAFMVVAGEVRTLADLSRRSIGEVAHITETIQTEIDGAVQAAADAYPLFEEQIGSVKRSGIIFESVRGHIGQFEDRLRSVTEAIDVLNGTQEELSLTVSQVSAASEEALAASEGVSSVSGNQTAVSEHLVRLSGQLEDVSKRLDSSLSRFTV